MDRRQAQGLDPFICTRAVASSCTLSHLQVSSEPAGSSPNSICIRLRARVGFPECPGKALDIVQAMPSTDGTSLIHRGPFFHLPTSQVQWEGLLPSGVLEAIRARAVLGRGTRYGHHDLIA